jgi:hypothetical protein
MEADVDWGEAEVVLAGRPTTAPIRSASGAFQAITVDAGTHPVNFGYAPPNIGLGLLALLAG